MNVSEILPKGGIPIPIHFLILL